MVAVLHRCVVAAALVGRTWGLRTLSLVEPPGMDESDVAEGFFDREADDVDSSDADLDWAVAEAIEESHPARLPSLESRLAATQGVSFARDGIRSAPSNSTLPADGKPEHPPHEGKWIPEGRRLFYGAHHKSGTNLLRNLCQEQLQIVHGRRCINIGYLGEVPPNCSAFPSIPQVWFVGNFTSTLAGRIARKNKYFRAVHIVRDPLAMAISGYVYHMHVTMDTPTGLEKVRNMSMVDALAAEGEYVLAGTGQEMARSYQINNTSILHVHLEDFTSSSTSFDRSALAVFEHMVGGYANDTDREHFLALARRHDLRRSLVDNITQGSGSHVANKDFKALAKEAIENIPESIMRRLKDLRMAVGYSA